MRVSSQTPGERKRAKSVVGQIVVVAIGVQLLFLGSFIGLKLPVATQRNISVALHNEELSLAGLIPARYRTPGVEQFIAHLPPGGEVRLSLYVPIVPMAIFLGYVLGAGLGVVTAALYFVGGLTATFFGIYPLAAGGGPDYYTQPGFGYLIGIVAAAWCAGWATAKRRTSFRQVMAVAGGLAAAHALGLAYLLGACLLSLVVEGAGRFPQWRPWVFEEARNLSWYTLPYDLLFSLMAVGLGFPFRWLVKTLTAPDIAAKARAREPAPDLDLV